MKTAKTIGYIVLALILAVCLVVNGVFVYVKFFAPEKTVVNTFNFSEITTETGEEEEDSAYIIKVKYYKNTKNNGLEAFEIMFNDFTDESQSIIYSSGIQIVANSQSESIDFDDYVYDATTEQYDETRFYYNGFWNYFTSRWGSYTPNNSTVSFYTSSSQFESFTLGADSSIFDDAFTITLSDSDGTSNIYRMNFVGNIYQNEEAHEKSANFVASYYSDWSWFRQYHYDYYYSYNIYAFAKDIYSKVNSATAAGTSSAEIVDVSDYFIFSKYNGSSYEEITADSFDKVLGINTTYGQIYFEVTEDGLSTASQSMFNAVNGSAQYNNGYGDTDDEGQTVDSTYGITKQVVTCDVYDFEYILVSDTYYALKLSDEFVSTYYSRRNEILLSVQIDLDVLDKQAITFYGFSDGTFDDYTVYECFTISDGVQTEVPYA